MTEDDGAAASPLERTFAAVVFDWDGTAVPDRRADAGRVRRLVEELCGHAVEVAVVSGTHLDNVDGQLAARPEGPDGSTCASTEVRGVRSATDGRGWSHGGRRRPRRTPPSTPQPRRSSPLARRGVHTVLVSQRLNRRKIDLIPEPEWADPPKARIGELLTAVLERLARAGLRGLDEAVELALGAALDAGLPDARVTSDAKHVEIGLTDKSDSARWTFDELRSPVGSGRASCSSVVTSSARSGAFPGATRSWWYPRRPRRPRSPWAPSRTERRQGCSVSAVGRGPSAGCSRRSAGAIAPVGCRRWTTTRPGPCAVRWTGRPPGASGRRC